MSAIKELDYANRGIFLYRSVAQLVERTIAERLVKLGGGEVGGSSPF